MLLTNLKTREYNLVYSIKFESVKNQFLNAVAILSQTAANGWFTLKPIKITSIKQPTY